MASRCLLLRRQRGWARRAGLTLDSAGCLPAVSANLRLPLSESAQADFNARGAAEFHDAGLNDGRRHVARMRAVHSSTALAVNVFDYWNARDPAPLSAALGLPDPIRRIAFEPHLATGLPGNPANPDILLELESGAPVAIECKFSEWLVTRRRRGGVFQARYFPPGRDVWREAGLPACQALAEDLQSGREYCRYLDAPQLLKHALGLAAMRHAGASLLYLYFDWPGSLADRHRGELGWLAARTGGELGFRAMTYQGQIDAMGAGPEADYRAYLAKRYGLRALEPQALHA